MTVWHVRVGVVPYGCCHFLGADTRNPSTPMVSITIMRKRDNAGNA